MSKLYRKDKSTFYLTSAILFVLDIRVLQKNFNKTSMTTSNTLNRLCRLLGCWVLAWIRKLVTAQHTFSRHCERSAAIHTLKVPHTPGLLHSVRKDAPSKGRYDSVGTTKEKQTKQTTTRPATQERDIQYSG